MRQFVRRGDGLGGTQFSAHPAIENTMLLRFAAMPRRGVEGSSCQKAEADSKLPASHPIRLYPRRSDVYLRRID
jgi:hypothetical protein